jgi:hypothetical protein
MIHVLSLGAGVQSSTLALMFADRRMQQPMPDAAIFADVGAEPAYVYTWLDWLETMLPFPVHRVMWKDGLTANIKDSIAGQRFAGAPFYTESDGKREGQLRRQCTREFKVHGQRAPRGKVLATQYLGISYDESLRMRPSRSPWIEHQWPLVELGMRRQDCLDWMKARGYPEPGRSACTYCPYHSDKEWYDLKTNHPDAFAEAIEMDQLVRDGVRGTEQKLYLHRKLKPIEEVKFDTAAAAGQADMFNEECEGMCGV